MSDEHPVIADANADEQASFERSLADRKAGRMYPLSDVATSADERCVKCSMVEEHEVHRLTDPPAHPFVSGRDADAAFEAWWQEHEAHCTERHGPELCSLAHITWLAALRHVRTGEAHCQHCYLRSYDPVVI